MFRRRNLSRRIVPIVLCISWSIFPQLSLLGQQTAKLPDWKANEALLDQLEAAISVHKFSIPPPKGYSFQTRLGPDGSKATAWTGPPRSDGTRPHVMLLTFTLPPEELRKHNLEQVLDELLASIRQRRKDWTRTATEKGLIHGLTFVRTRWNGRDLSTGLKMHGFIYVAIVGETVIQLSSQDIEPHHEQALKLAELSVLTFEGSSRAGLNRASCQGNTNGI